ncbi:MAG: DUF3566 domain-containing protein [Actinomycetia bacterium]|nr:DUF3566 domain-containing protein [Actinomycetes bacterium]
MPHVVDDSHTPGHPAGTTAVPNEESAAAEDVASSVGEEGAAELYGWTKSPDEGSWIRPNGTDDSDAEEAASTRRVGAKTGRPIRGTGDTATSATVAEEPTEVDDQAGDAGESPSAGKPTAAGREGPLEAGGNAAPEATPRADAPQVAVVERADSVAPEEARADVVQQAPAEPAVKREEPPVDRRQGHPGMPGPAPVAPGVAPGVQVGVPPVMVGPPVPPMVVMPPPQLTPPPLMQPPGAPPAAVRVRPAGAPQAGAAKKARSHNRRARLFVSHINVWSVMRMGLMVSLAVGIVLFVAMSAIWMIIDQSQVLEQAQSLIDSLVGNGSASGLQISRVLDTQRVLAFAAVVSVLNVVLMTLLITIFGALYNAIAAIFGGLEITLSEEH